MSRVINLPILKPNSIEINSGDCVPSLPKKKKKKAIKKHNSKISIDIRSSSFHQLYEKIVFVNTNTQETLHEQTASYQCVEYYLSLP